jgi:hypothetical protein
MPTLAVIVAHTARVRRENMYKLSHLSRYNYEQVWQIAARGGAVA